MLNRFWVNLERFTSSTLQIGKIQRKNQMWSHQEQRNISMNSSKPLILSQACFRRRTMVNKPRILVIHVAIEYFQKILISNLAIWSVWDCLQSWKMNNQLRWKIDFRNISMATSRFSIGNIPTNWESSIKLKSPWPLSYGHSTRTWRKPTERSQRKSCSFWRKWP